MNLIVQLYVTLRGKTFTLFQTQPIFGANARQIKNGRQSFYSIVGCAVVLWWWKPLHLTPSSNRRSSQDRTDRNSKLPTLFHTKYNWGTPPGNVQGHVRRSIRYEHFDSPPFFWPCPRSPSLRYLRSPAKCCCDTAHIKIMSSPLHSECPLGLMCSKKEKKCATLSNPTVITQCFQLASSRIKTAVSKGIKRTSVPFPASCPL